MKQKPTPSIVASFFIFVFTGIYSIFCLESNFYSELPSLIKAFLFLAVLFNAVYYYITEIETEFDFKLQEKLKMVHKSEWYIRVINQAILFSLWFLLQLPTISFFAIGLFLLFLSYLVWDVITYSCFDNNKLFVLDLAGFIFTIIFIIIGYVHFYAEKEPGYLDENRKFAWGFIWGACVFVYIMIPIIGVLFKHPPKFLMQFINKNTPV